MTQLSKISNCKSHSGYGWLLCEKDISFSGREKKLLKKINVPDENSMQKVKQTASRTCKREQRKKKETFKGKKFKEDGSLGPF